MSSSLVSSRRWSVVPFAVLAISCHGNVRSQVAVLPQPDVLPQSQLWNINAAGDVYRLEGQVGIGTNQPNARLTVSGGISLMGADPALSGGRVLEIIESQSFYPLTGAGGVTLRAAHPHLGGHTTGPRADVLRYDGNTVLATTEHGASLGWVGIGTRAPNERLTVQGSISMMGVDPATSGGRVVEIHEIPSYNPQSGAGGFSIQAAHPHSGGYSSGPKADVLRFNGNTALATDSLGSPLGFVGIGTRQPQSRLQVIGTTTTDVLTITGGSDVVEQFESRTEDLPPGTVLIIDPINEGELMASSGASDPCVAGVVSGAGGVAPGISLSQKGVLDGDVPVTLLGRVYVRCSAENGPIVPGDRLVTASLVGHAMRADRKGEDGTILGKAMSSLSEGTGLVLVLINLQ